jgi:hypothetical protein
MGNKYHVLHRHLSRLSRPDDLGVRSRRSLYAPSCREEVFSETGSFRCTGFSGTLERPIFANRDISNSTPMASLKSRP